MPRDKSHDGVHKTHCCWYHGCKYCDPKCPVVKGKIKQAYSCEDCDEDGFPDIPAEELRGINKRVESWLERWYDDKQEDVDREIHNTADQKLVFWFVAKLGSYRSVGQVWTLLKMLENFE